MDLTQCTTAAPFSTSLAFRTLLINVCLNRCSIPSRSKVRTRDVAVIGAGGKAGLQHRSPKHSKRPCRGQHDLRAFSELEQGLLIGCVGDNEWDVLRTD